MNQDQSSCLVCKDFTDSRLKYAHLLNLYKGPTNTWNSQPSHTGASHMQHRQNQVTNAATPSNNQVATTTHGLSDPSSFRGRHPHCENHRRTKSKTVLRFRCPTPLAKSSRVAPVCPNMLTEYEREKAIKREKGEQSGVAYKMFYQLFRRKKFYKIWP